MAVRGEKFAALTCYDATTARWLAKAGVHVLLVGDSAGQVILGHDSAIHTPLDLLIELTAAVRRGAPDRFVMADMPFMSYQADDAEALRNAGRFMAEGRADAVKLEVDEHYGDLVARMARAGIPAVAHIGWRPQQVRAAGVRTAVVAGRTAAEARRLVEQAELMQARGAAMILIEQTPAEVAQAVIAAVDVPVIGCGAGPACHGRVVVLQDMLGMNERTPSFAQPLGEVGPAIETAARAWVKHVQADEDPAGGHPYAMNEGEADRLRRG
jgi:3-methyl-2-oxobutanoate hydroxymethyltransferase